MIKQIIYLLAKYFYPELISERQDLLTSAKEIGKKLMQVRTEMKAYRDRAFAAEKLCRDILKMSKSSAREHDIRYGTCIHWNVD